MPKIQIFKHERMALLKKAMERGLVKLVFFDLETSLMEIYTHYIGQKVSIYHNQIKNDKKIITIQWMLEGDKGASYVKWDKDGNSHSDAKAIATFVKTVLNKDNIVAIGQNSKSFDHKVLNDRIKSLGLTPVEDLIKVDILTASRQSFRSASHKLDYRSAELGFGGKIKMEFDDWVKIQNNDPKALAKMIKYGLKDVTDLRKIFWRELPYYETLPARLNKVLIDLKKEDVMKSKSETKVCSKCRDGHRPSRRIFKVKGVDTCKNCGQSKYLETL